MVQEEMGCQNNLSKKMDPRWFASWRRRVLVMEFT